jgi:hypothetical protein
MRGVLQWTESSEVGRTWQPASAVTIGILRLPELLTPPQELTLQPRRVVVFVRFVPSADLAVRGSPVESGWEVAGEGPVDIVLQSLPNLRNAVQLRYLELDLSRLKAEIDGERVGLLFWQLRRLLVYYGGLSVLLSKIEGILDGTDWAIHPWKPAVELHSRVRARITEIAAEVKRRENLVQAQTILLDFAYFVVGLVMGLVAGVLLVRG